MSADAGSTVEPSSSAAPERPDVWGIIKRAIEISYKDRRTFLGLAALVGFPMLLALIVPIAMETDISVAMQKPEQGLLGLLLGVLWLAFGILSIYFIGAINVLTAYRLDGRGMTWGDAFSWIRQRELFWPIVLVGVLTGLAVAGGLILLIIPGIVFAVWFMLAYPARVLGENRGTRALSESRRLVRPFFIDAFVLGLVLVIVGGIPVWIAQGTTAAVWGLVSNAAGRHLIPAFVSYAMFILWAPVAGVAIALFYIERSGGLGSLRDDLFL